MTPGIEINEKLWQLVWLRGGKKRGYKCANFGWPQKISWSRFLKQPGKGVERGNMGSSHQLRSV